MSFDFEKLLHCREHCSDDSYEDAPSWRQQRQCGAIRCTDILNDKDLFECNVPLASFNPTLWQLTSPVVSELTNSCPRESNASPTGRTHSSWHLVRSAAWTIKLYPFPAVLDAAGPLPDQGILVKRSQVTTAKFATLSIIRTLWHHNRLG